MKKKIFGLFILLMGVFVLTGCDKAGSSNKEVITLEDTTLNYVTTFEVPAGTDFKMTEEITGGKYKEIEIESERENISFDMYYSETGSSSYEKLKENRSSNKYYKEYKYGKYDAYVYSDYDSSLYLDIKLEEDKDKKVIRSIFVSVDTITYDNSDVIYNMFNRDVVQEFFNSIKFTKK